MRARPLLCLFLLVSLVLLSSAVDSESAESLESESAASSSEGSASGSLKTEASTSSTTLAPLTTPPPALSTGAAQQTTSTEGAGIVSAGIGSESSGTYGGSLGSSSGRNGDAYFKAFNITCVTTASIISFIEEIQDPEESIYKIDYDGYCDMSEGSGTTKRKRQSSSFDDSMLTIASDANFPDDQLVAVRYALERAEKSDLLGVRTTEVEQIERETFPPPAPRAPAADLHTHTMTPSQLAMTWLFGIVGFAAIVGAIIYFFRCRDQPHAEGRSQRLLVYD